MMNLPLCTQEEVIGFDHISDFIYPNDVFDVEALNLFLKAYVQNNSGGTRSGEAQVEAIGLLLRLIPLDSQYWGDTFEQWYIKHREEKGLYFDDWFQYLNPEQREKTKVEILRMLDGAPPITTRVSLMMDGMQYYPELPTKTFIGKSLLRVKSNSFVKALKPRPSQMHLVLQMAKALQNENPEFSALAQSIALAVFVQRLSEKPASLSPQQNYSASEAFLLLLDNGIKIEPVNFIAAAKSRFKNATLLVDILQFVNWALSPIRSKYWLIQEPTKNEKEFALLLAPAILEEVAAFSSSGLNETMIVNIHKYCNLYQKDPTLDVVVRDFLTKKLNTTSKNTMSPTSFVYLVEHLLEPSSVNDAWLTFQKNKNLGSSLNIMEQYLSENIVDYHASPQYFKLLSEYAGPVTVIQALLKSARSLFSLPENLVSSDAVKNKEELSQIYQNTSYLQKLSRFFEKVNVLASQDVHQSQEVRQMIAASSMTYLYYGSTYKNSCSSRENGGFVNIAAQPLPLLRTMYPEHNQAINQVRKEIIRKNTERASNTQYDSSYYELLYQVLGTAFYTPNVFARSNVENLTAAIGIDVYSYFHTAMRQIEVSFEIPTGTFEDLSYA